MLVKPLKISLFSKNEHQLLAVINKIVIAGFGLITALLIASKLTPEQQGLHFLFQSLIGFSALAEMGVTYSVIQLTSKALGKKALSRVDNRRLVGARYLLFTVKWFAFASIYSAAILGPVGQYWIMMGKNLSGQNVGDYIFFWYILVISNSVTLSGNGLLGFFEGYGDISGANLSRIVINTVYHSTIVAGMYCGFEAKSIVLASCAANIAFLCVVFKKYRKQVTTLLRLALSRSLKVDWVNEIKPFQTRISISWLSGFIANQLTLPLIYRYLGSIEAGRIGLSFQLCSVLNGISIAWPLASASKLARAFALNEHDRRRIIFRNDLLISIAIFSTLVLLLISSISMVSMLNIFDANRIVPVKIILFVLIPLAFVTHLNNLLAIYIRSSGVEPLTKCSIVTSMLTLSLNIYCIPRFGPLGAILPTTIVAALISLPWIYFHYNKDNCFYRVTQKRIQFENIK
jgi:hypothetical protein